MCDKFYSPYVAMCESPFSTSRISCFWQRHNCNATNTQLFTSAHVAHTHTHELIGCSMHTLTHIHCPVCLSDFSNLITITGLGRTNYLDVVCSVMHVEGMGDRQPLGGS